MARGGLKFLRGAVADYVKYFTSEERAGCLDHGYYGDGERWTVNAAGKAVHGDWTPEQYAAWLAGADPETGEQRGRALHAGELRQGVRGYEYGVNLPKSASVAAWLDPELAVALKGAQERAAVAGIHAVRRAARVRITDDGTTRLVDVDELEVAVFGHDGSREGDPHAHLHVQIGSKVFVEGKWRALAGRPMVRALDDWQATVSATLATDPQWIAACAARGLTVTTDGGIKEIGEQAEALFSRRGTAIRAEQDRLIDAFVQAEGHSPGARDMVAIHQKAWNMTRPKKGEKALLTGDAVRARLLDAGMGNLVDQIDRMDARDAVDVAVFDRQAAARAALAEATTREVLVESDLRLIAAAGIAAVGGAIADIEAELTFGIASLRAQCVPVRLPSGEDVWVPAPVMEAATAVQAHLERIREDAIVQTKAVLKLDTAGLTDGQQLVAEAIAGGMPVVVEGPAGTGKSTALRRALAARNEAGLMTIALAPSRTAVQQLGEGWTRADTAHGFLIRAGWRQHAGLWSAPVMPEDAEDLRGAVIIVDEAAMLDLHTMAALTEHARERGARVALVGDDRQLSPVGVSGGFALAKAGSDVVMMTETKRFADPAFADLAADWRSGSDLDRVVDGFMAAGVVQIHDRDEDAHATLAEIAAGGRDRIVMVADNATAVTINRLVRAEHESAGTVARGVRDVGRFGEDIGVGDLVQTRLNDRASGLVNRQRWVVTAIGDDKSLTVRRADQSPDNPRAIVKQLPADYVAAHVHRADAVTVHAAQGSTSKEGHALLDSTWTREQAYVAITRGKATNVLHVVAEDAEDARAVLMRVLRSSEADRAAALVEATRMRFQEARVDITPGIAARMRAATRSFTDMVGGWVNAGGPATGGPQMAPPAIQKPAAPTL